jgi:hypothetical protein
MRALICTPATGPLIGVRSGGSGEIVSRSARGVNAPGGGIELSGGVVLSLAVVKSGLSAHVASTSLPPKCASTCSQRLGAAGTGAGLIISAARVTTPAHHKRREEFGTKETCSEESMAVLLHRCMIAYYRFQYDDLL